MFNFIKNSVDSVVNFFDAKLKAVLGFFDDILPTPVKKVLVFIYDAISTTISFMAFIVVVTAAPLITIFSILFLIGCLAAVLASKNQEKGSLNRNAVAVLVRLSRKLKGTFLDWLIEKLSQVTTALIYAAVVALALGWTVPVVSTLALIYVILTVINRLICICDLNASVNE